MNDNPFPHIAAPAGAVTVSEWCDLEYPEDTYRCLVGQRRGVDRYMVKDSPVGPHFVEAHAIQESSGKVLEHCVRAEIKAWNWNRYEDWATELSAEEARVKAAEMRTAMTEMAVLADALDAAANEVETWTNPSRRNWCKYR